MTTFNARTLPILDLSLLEDGKIDPSLVETAEQSLREVGFFVVKNHGVSEELIKNTFGKKHTVIQLAHTAL